MGRSEVEALRVQASSWKNVWDPDQRSLQHDVMMLVDSLAGEFLWDEAYVEGNAWHYRWGAPFDVEGMIAVQNDGDKSAFVDEFESYWAQVYVEEDDLLPDDWYWHGNEPDLHYAYLASIAGDWKASAAPIRWVMANRYADDPVGLDGNDDGGTLSAWYLFSAIGLYPIAGTDAYAVGSPIFSALGSMWMGSPLFFVASPNQIPRWPFTRWSATADLTPVTIKHSELVSGEWLFHLE